MLLLCPASDADYKSLVLPYSQIVDLHVHCQTTGEMQQFGIGDCWPMCLRWIHATGIKR